MAKAMAISARLHPKTLFRGAMKTLQAYRSNPQVVLPRTPPRSGIHRGNVVSVEAVADTATV
jgi:hypothetical protein